MKVKISQIIEMAAISLGEDIELTTEATADNPYPFLSKKVRQEIESCLRDIYIERGDDPDAGWKPMPINGLTPGDGYLRLRLPDDFLRLRHLKIKGWKVPVREALPVSHRLYGLQSGNTGIRMYAAASSPERPRAFVAPAGDDGLELRLFGSSDSDIEGAEGWYLPAPRIDEDDCIEIAPGLLPILVSRLTSTVKENI